MVPTPQQRTLLWLVAIGFFMEILDSTIINTALPEMARDLNESPFETINGFSPFLATSIAARLPAPPEPIINTSVW